MFRAWLRRILGIDAEIKRLECLLVEQERRHTVVHVSQRARIEEAVKFIRDKTEISADVSFNKHGASQVIVIGRYRNRDYIQVYTISSDHFTGLVETLREWERYATVRRVDAPIGFREVIDREFKF